MNKHFYLFLLVIFWAESLSAQINQGSRLTAMGYNGAAVKDIWGVAANPATINYFSSISAQLSHKEHYLSKTIRNQALAVVIPKGRQALGINLQRYGIPEYNSLTIGISASRQFGPKLAIEMRANYHQLKIENYGVTTAISADLGAYYQLSQTLSFGICLNNLSKERYRTKAIYAVIPSQVYFGVAYKTSAKVLMASTISKDDVAVGIDYQFFESFSLRGGLSIQPFTHYFGVGFSKSKFLADFAFTKPSRFSYSPQLTIGYVF